MKAHRAVSKRDSALARYRLLCQALSGIPDVPKQLQQGCGTQAAFAAMTIGSLGIERVALNTLKASADASIEIGGWIRLDRMRRQYKQMRKTSRKQLGGAQQAMPAAEALALERRVRIRLEVAYIDLLNKLMQLARTHGELEDFLQRHRAGFALKRMKTITGGRHDA